MIVNISQTRSENLKQRNTEKNNESENGQSHGENPSLTLSVIVAFNSIPKSFGAEEIYEKVIRGIQSSHQ